MKWLLLAPVGLVPYFIPGAIANPEAGITLGPPPGDPHP